MIVEMICEAKCKHCIFFKRQYPFKKDGTKSKRGYYVCGNKKSNRHKQYLTIKSKACDSLEF